MRRFLYLATLSLAAAAADTFAAETAQPPASCDLPLQQHLQASAAGGEEELITAICQLILECGGSAADIVSAAIEQFPEQAVLITLTAQPTAAGTSADDGPAGLPNSIGLPTGGSEGGSASGIIASSS